MATCTLPGAPRGAASVATTSASGSRFSSPTSSATNLMRFSLYTELQNPPGKAHAQTYGELLEAIDQADRLGYHNVSLVEHPWFEQFSISASPLAVFTAAAQ